MSEKINFVFLHGGGQGGWVWNETITALKLQAGEEVCALAADLPGCGLKRDQDTTNLTVRDAAASFIEDLVTSGMTDIVLVGHSNAGTILPKVAEVRPDLVRKYVYVSCVVPPEGTSIMQLLRTKPSHVVHDQVPSAGKLAEMLCSDMAEEDTSQFMAKLGADLWPTLTALDESDWRYDHLHDKNSTYVICLQDQAHSVDWQETFAARVHANRRVLIDAGHQVMNTRPHGLAEILLAEARTSR